MNPLLFSLVTSMCFSNYSSQTCNKTIEASLKQEGYWDYSEKLTNWAKKQAGDTASYLLAGGYELVKQKQIKLVINGQTKYNLIISRDSYSCGITFKLPELE